MHTDACHSVSQIIVPKAVPVLAWRNTSLVLSALVTVSPRLCLLLCVLEVLSHHFCCAMEACRVSKAQQTQLGSACAACMTV